MSEFLDRIDYWHKLSDSEKGWLKKFQRLWHDETRNDRCSCYASVGITVPTYFLDLLLDQAQAYDVGILQKLGVFPTSRVWENYSAKRERTNKKTYRTEDYTAMPAILAKRFDDVIIAYIDSKCRHIPESGIPGITWRSLETGWKAVRFFNGTLYNLGVFQNVSEAIDTLCEWNKKHAHTGFGADWGPK